MVHLPRGKPSAKKNTAAGFPRGSYLGIAANRPLFLRRIVTAAAKVLRCGKNIRQTIMGVHKVEKLKNDGAFYKRFFSLTITIALQNLIVFSVNLADNLMLGGYSEQALSGVALANQIQFLLQMLVMGAGEGMIVLASQYWGKKEVEPIRRIISIGFRFGLAAGLLLAVIMFFFPYQVLGLLTNEAAVIEEGVSYIRVICFSYLFFAMTNILLSALRSVETVKIAFAVSASTLCINVFLNSLLIYGNLGAPRLGAQGAAIATLIARIVEFFIMLWYLKFKDKKLNLHARDLLVLDWELLRRYVRVGCPVILSNGIWGIAQAVQTGILGHLGGPAIAANSIATTVFQIITVISYGAASATAVLTGKTIGEGHMDKLRHYSKVLQVLYLIIGLCTGLLLFLLKDVIIQFYSISGETKELAIQFMLVLSVTVIGTSYQVAALTGLVRGGGDTKFVLFNDSIFMWLIVIPSAALAAFVFNAPPVVVFGCLKCDQILKCAVAFVKVNYGKWIRRLTQ